jgi:hypothetical protein
MEQTMAALTVTKPQIGSIISGTTRACDLADAYLGACDQFGVTLDPQTVGVLQAAACYATSTVAPEFSEETYEALSEVESELGGIAPFGCYFGAHTGDGSDFGFWLGDNWAEAFEDRCIDESDYETVLSICEDEQIDSDDFADAWEGEVSACSEDQAGAAYAQQTAEDCGMVDDAAKWPHNCINWEEAWRQLEQDGYSAHRLSNARWAIIRAV